VNLPSALHAFPRLAPVRTVGATLAALLAHEALAATAGAASTARAPLPYDHSGWYTLLGTALVTAVVAVIVTTRLSRSRLRQVQDERNFARFVMESMGQGLGTLNDQFRFTYVNPPLAKLYGRTPEELVGMDPMDLMSPEDRARVEESRKHRQPGAPSWFEITIRRPDGSAVHAQVTVTTHVSEGSVMGRIAVVTDLTERRAAEEAIQREAAYARALVDVARLNEQNLDPFEVASRTIEIIAPVAGADWGGLQHLQGNLAHTKSVWDSGRNTDAFVHFITSKPLPRPNGLVWHAFDSGRPVYSDDYARDPAAAAAITATGVKSAAWVPVWRRGNDGFVFSMTRMQEARPWSERDRGLFEAASLSVRVAIERQVHMQALERAALEDALTGLGNRRAFEYDLEVELARTHADGQRLAVLMVDLNGMKRVNDMHGHEQGDALLRAFGQAMARRLRGNDRVYRLGGDEFAAIMLGAEPNAVDILHGRVADAVCDVHAAGFPEAGAAAGFAFCPDDGDSIRELLNAADTRMYVHKERQRAQRS